MIPGAVTVSNAPIQEKTVYQDANRDAYMTWGTHLDSSQKTEYTRIRPRI